MMMTGQISTEKKSRARPTQFFFSRLRKVCEIDTIQHTTVFFFSTHDRTDRQNKTVHAMFVYHLHSLLN